MMGRDQRPLGGPCGTYAAAIALLITFRCLHPHPVAFAYPSSPLGRLRLFQRDVQRVAAEQVQEDSEYSPKNLFPPLTWEAVAGTFNTALHFNVHDNPVLRRSFAVPDTTAFTGLDILYNLLETSRLCDHFQATAAGTAAAASTSSSMCAAASASITDEFLHRSVAGLGPFRDPNFAPPRYGFWPYEPAPAPLTGYWQAPDNPLGLFIPLNEVISALPPGKDKQALEALSKNLQAIARAPGDSDDTGSTWAVWSQLLLQQQRFPQSAAAATLLNTDPQGAALTTLASFTYQPYSNDLSRNLINPWSYVWLHPWLTSSNDPSLEAVGLQPQQLSIIATWTQLLDEQLQQRPLIKSPYGPNDVDLVVVCNAVRGMLWLLLQRPEVYAPGGVIPAEVDVAIKSSVAMVAWALSSGTFAAHVDLVGLYYPTITTGYYIAAKLYELVVEPRVGASQSVLPAVQALLDACKAALQPAMEGAATQQLLKSSVTLGALAQGRRGQQQKAWPGVLGVASDAAPLLRQPQLTEDVVYSTASALGALLSIWTRSGAGVKGLQWLPTTPSTVKSAAAAAGSFLTNQSKLSATNAYFVAGILKRPLFKSGQVYFPTNYDADLYDSTKRYSCGTIGSGSDPWDVVNPPTNIEEIVGDPANPLVQTLSTFDAPRITGVSGVMSEEEYQRKLNQGQCGKVKVAFPNPGFNCALCYGPYWDSPAVTYSVRALQLLKLQMLQDSRQ